MKIGYHFRSKFQSDDRHALSTFILLSILLISTNLIWLPAFLHADILSDGIRQQLLLKLNEMSSLRKFVCRGEILCATLAIPRFYERRDFRPAWIVASDPLSQADALIDAIRDADREGLKPEDYHLAEIQSSLAEVRQNKVQRKSLHPENLVDLDLLLTDAFLLYASHLLAGRVNPETIHTEWIAYSRTADLAHILQTALDSNQIQKVLHDLLPPHPGYQKLREALSQYRIIASTGGWPAVTPGSVLRKGDRDMRVDTLRNRLAISGDLDFPFQSQPDLFDDSVEQAVRGFQKRHGVEVDGIVGPNTLAVLNITVEEKLRTLEINMERWRWIPHNLGRRHILVNLASFGLSVVEDGREAIFMKTVVGRPARMTPVFSGAMTYLVINPYWHIPTKIAVEDILPKIRQDPNYLSRQHIRVFQSWDERAPEVAPEAIDWSKINGRNFVYKLRQNPGPLNALGRIKFMFPNKFSVYLHDTPARGLFKEVERDFSAGCIRISKPIELAEYLLKGSTEWTREKVLRETESGRRQVVRLPDPIPVHVLYWTASVDADGKINFLPDIYRRDEALSKALEEGPPKP